MTAPITWRFDKPALDAGVATGNYPWRGNDMRYFPRCQGQLWPRVAEGKKLSSQ